MSTAVEIGIVMLAASCVLLVLAVLFLLIALVNNNLRKIPKYLFLASGILLLVSFGLCTSG